MRSQDPCDSCLKGVMLVYCTRRLPGDKLARRYLRCSHCQRHGAQLIPAPPKRRSTNPGTKLAKSPDKVPDPERFPLREASEIRSMERTTYMEATFMEKLLDIGGAADFSAVDESTILRWAKTGIMPEPMLIDGLPRWHPETLRRWAIDGCPVSQPLHHRIMNQIRKGHLEDSFRAGDARTKTIAMESEEL